MAGVDHTYQYSVEVKSKFSLFLNDALNEDPDLLLTKLKNERSGRQKKDKSLTNVALEQRAKVEVPSNEVKVPVTPVKDSHAPKPSAPAQIEESSLPVRSKSAIEDNMVSVQRGRGGRGFGRGFIGRGQGPRQAAEDRADSAGDMNQRDVTYDPRGRGRGRARGGFVRGRGAAYTDYREYDGQTSEPPEQRRQLRREVPGEPTSTETNHEDHAETVETKQTTNAREADVQETKENGEVIEEPPSYTLEEYKALRSNVKPAVTLSTKGSRKANDGKDVFANMVAHRKVNEMSDDEIEEIVREPEVKQNIDIDITFIDHNKERGRGGFGQGGFERGRGSPGFRGDGRPRGFRGTRSGFRGEGRGRGFRGGMIHSEQAHPPVVLSDQDFPSLK